MGTGQEVAVRALWTDGMPHAEEGPWTLRFAGGRIEEIRRGAGDGLRVVDGTAVPGFVDCHDHIGIDPGDEHSQSIQPAGTMILRGAANLRTMVESGVTTMRDCGERHDVEAYWVEAVADGTLLGPRIVRSISPISRTGGHAWYLGRETDGADALRARVREHARAGTQFIKVMASGGFGTLGSDQRLAEYTKEELVALVDESHRLGLPVAAHGHGGVGVDQAIDAGVDTIEHGALLTTAQLEKMAERNIALVLTNGVTKAFCTDPEVPALIRAIMPALWDSACRVTAAARELGVLVALGCDGMQGRIADEARILTDCGYSRLEALRAATESGARAIGRTDIGRIEVGAAADVLFVAGDPTADIQALSRPIGVVAQGTWIRPGPWSVAEERLAPAV